RLDPWSGHTTVARSSSDSSGANVASGEEVGAELAVASGSLVDVVEVEVDDDVVPAGSSSSSPASSHHARATMTATASTVTIAVAARRSSRSSSPAGSSRALCVSSGPFGSAMGPVVQICTSDADWLMSTTLFGTVPGAARLWGGAPLAPGRGPRHRGKVMKATARGRARSARLAILGAALALVAAACIPPPEEPTPTTLPDGPDRINFSSPLELGLSI